MSRFKSNSSNRQRLSVDRDASFAGRKRALGPQLGDYAGDGHCCRRRVVAGFPGSR